MSNTNVHWQHLRLFVKTYPAELNPSRSDVVVCIHGSESHTEWFRPTMHHLDKIGLPSLAYDRQGCGRSPGARGAFSLRTAQQDFHEVLRPLIKSGSMIHLLALSWGGPLAISFAKTARYRIKSATLVSPGIFPILPMPISQRLRYFFSAVKLRQNFRLPLPFTPQDFANDRACQVFIENDQYRNQSIDIGFILATKYLQRIARNPPSRIVPALQVALGDSDKIIDLDKTIRWTNRFKLKLHQIPKSSHALTLEQPAAIASRVASHIYSLARSETKL